MGRRFVERLKLHEDCRVPVLGGILYNFWNEYDNQSILSERIPDAPLNREKREEVVTVSMTSYPARIHCVHLAIKSLLLQSYPADRIILGLAESQFEGKKLPRELTDLVKYGVEINWCDDPYGHKKYYYCVRAQKENEVVITFDDDIIYPVDAIKRLMKKHKEYPHCVVCERAQAIDYDKNGELKNPGKWKTISDIGVKSPSYSLNPSPGGGCLLPFGAFCEDAVNEDKIRNLAYKNDDLWYMFMAAQNGTRIIKTRKYHKTFSVINGSQGEQMATENVVGDRNQQIMKVLKESYPCAYERIITDKDSQNEDQ